MIIDLPSIIKDRKVDEKYLFNNEIRIWNGTKLLCEHSKRKDRCVDCEG